MSLTEGAVRHAVCTNVGDCKKAADGELLEWYPGAGEYCPECGEALSLGAESAAPPPAVETASHAGVPTLDDLDLRTPTADTDAAVAAFRARRRERTAKPSIRLWIALGALAAIVVAVFAGRWIAVDRASGKTVEVCAIPSAQQLAADLIRAYAAKTGAPAGAFVLTTSSSCDVRFSTAAQSADAVVAHDGIVVIVNPLNPIARISEAQLRALYSGRINDWSQLGGPPGSVVRLLPETGSDEAKVLAASLFFGVEIDPRVHRGGASADVTRLVTGADSVSRRAIGIVAFSQSVAAKVVPLTYLPPPNVLSIASGRYPFTLSIAVQSDSGASAAAGLVDFARSHDGAAIVLKNGLIPREGL